MSFLSASRIGADDDLEPVVFAVNGDESMRKWIEDTVSAAGFRAITFATANELRARVSPETVACAVLEVASSDASCFELQRDLSRAGAAIVFLTTQSCIRSCVQAIKAGAVDFLTMPCDPVRLTEALSFALDEARSLRAGRMQFAALLAKHELLTVREREVFMLVSSGLMNKQIAQSLDISEITVQIHRTRVMRKMEARSFASLVRMADALLAQPGLHSNPLYRIDSQAWQMTREAGAWTKRKTVGEGHATKDLIAARELIESSHRRPEPHIG